MDTLEPVLAKFQDQSHFSKLKQVSASDMIKVFKEKKQILITIQTLGFILLFLIPVRLILLIIGLYPPPKDSKLSFLRRIHNEMESVFEFHFLKVACAFRGTCEKVIGAEPLMSFKAFLNVYH